MYNWVTIRKQPRTEGPNYPPRVAQTVDAVVAKWIPVTAALLGCFVTPSRAKLDVRTYDWHNAAPISEAAKLIDANVQKWMPGVNEGPNSYRVRSRPRLDVGKYDWVWSPLLPPTPSVTVAQAFPAILAQTQSFRTTDRPKLDLVRASWDAGMFATPPTWATWVPFQETGGRTRASAPQIDVRLYEWSSPAWMPAVTAPLVAQWSPAYTGAKSERTAAIVQRQTETVATWLVQPPAGGPTVAQTAPAWVDKGIRTKSRPRLDVRAYEWGTPAWAQTATAPFVAQLFPSQLAETQTFRTAAQAQYDVRQYDWLQSTVWTPQVVDKSVAAWLPAIVVRSDRTVSQNQASVTSTPLWSAQAPSVGPTPAQTVAAWVNVGGRSGDRDRLDVRRVEWSPESGWMLTPVSPVLARQWPAILHGLLSFRTPEGGKLEVQRIEWSWPLAQQISSAVHFGEIIVATIDAFNPARTIDAPAIARTLGAQAIDYTLKAES
jgi:hypothetical protein